MINWEHRGDNGTDLSAERSANILLITGKVDGKQIVKSFDLDQKPWYQFLSFSLKSFLNDNKARTIIFWMLRPDTLKPIPLEATKAGVKTIPLNAENIKAVKIKVAPHGLMGKLWHAHYWYRLSDFLFIMYRGTHGGPLTPKTMITLDK